MPYLYPPDFQSSLPGFGGNPSKNRQQHQEALAASNFPVTILLHGQVANAFHPTWGMETLRDNLMARGVPGELIFACSWLGENNRAKHTDYPVRRHIGAVRAWIGSIIDYFGGHIKVNVIGHSLGGMMAKGWLYGYQSDGSWDNSGAGKVGLLNALVLLASNNYGMGPGMPTEFATGSSFEENSHSWFGEVEDSACGCDAVDKMIAPEAAWKKTTSHDDGRCRYVSIIAANDYVDQFQRDTSRVEGADKNVRRDLGLSLIGHEAVIKRNAIVSEFLEDLKKRATARMGVNRESGNYGSDLEVTVSVDPVDLDISYEARRIRKAMELGFIKELEYEKRTGTLHHDELLILSSDGMWEVAFTAAGAEPVRRTYGVNVTLPIVAMVTPNEPDFENLLEVSATTTRGTLYYSFNGLQFNEGGNVTITEDRVVYFIAIDEEGMASEIVSRVYRKKIPYTDVKYGTATEHYVAGRLDPAAYIAMGSKYGYLQKFNLYLINGAWTDDYRKATVDRAAPELSVNHGGGTYTEPLEVTIRATDQEDPAPVIYYTTDGTPPTDGSPHGASSVTVLLDVNGTHRLKYFAKDRSGNRTNILTETYTIELATPLPDVTADPASGEYEEEKTVTLTAQQGATVYYTEDGGTPDTNSDSFTSAKRFEITGNGNHAIRCLCLSGEERVYRDFYYTIDDRGYPETGIAPSWGGSYAGSVDITLTVKNVEWTKYTTDGTDPGEEAGIFYKGEPFTLTETTTLKWGSKDFQGNLEPVNTALFTITKELNEKAFAGDPAKGGYVKANGDGSGSAVGTFRSLAVGTGHDGKINRAFLHFDTASLPDNATIKRAYLLINYMGEIGDPWAGDGELKIDVQKGYFGSSLSLQADDWGAPATAEGVARIEGFSMGVKKSGYFKQEGLDAINMTGITQIRLRFDPHPSGTGQYVLVKGGTGARLVIEYSDS